ncbi:MAG: class I SAM-dependent methyltransferase [Ignavibacteriae bacterium]|nr:MAG: class I SAM-dependent methyltransferase [Ignavibacteriota bacterium]
MSENMQLEVSAMDPFGRALRAYYEGDADAGFILRRDDGFESCIPSRYFFRDENAFTRIEQKAVGLCRGRVLDIGAGTGSVCLVLQRNGYDVTAIDICPHAVDIMRQRGVHDVACADVFSFNHNPFDTVLMLGHGIGMVQTLEGLDRFLIHAHSLVNDKGQLLIDSLDVRRTDDSKHLVYHLLNRHAGRYIGEVRMRFEFLEFKGPYSGWLQVDPETLRIQSESAGWQFETVSQEDNGDYLARLIKKKE